ncbi:MAG: hypothetical protein EH225_00270, partial [Calditrichaeota bacterium]
MTSEKYKIVIAGAGGIGRAAGLLLREIADFECDIFLGDKFENVAREAAEWILENSGRKGQVDSFEMTGKK